MQEMEESGIRFDEYAVIFILITGLATILWFISTIQYIVGNKLYRPQKNLDLKGRYYEVLAHQLSEVNLFVSAINPKLWNVHSGIADIRIYVYQIVL